MQLIASNLAIEKIGNDKKVNSEEFQKIVDDVFGRNKAIGTIDDVDYLVSVNKTNNLYTIEDNGSVIFAGKNNDFPKDTTPGVLDGDGTEENPYLIMSIEDLVAFSYNVNKDSNYAKDKVFALGRNLYFDGKLRSYVNSDSKYEASDYGYIPSETATTTIKELMTTGEGFISIGKTEFSGNFDGKGHSIANIKTKNNEPLFYYKKNGGFIKNLGIEEGEFGGILYYYNNSNEPLLIENCYNTGTVEGTGGIINASSGTVTIENCYNTGTVTSNDATGGIMGTNNGAITIKNCYNTGKITSEGYKTDNTGGIIGAHDEGRTIIENCYNKGNITGGSCVGGMIGYARNNVTVNRCDNKGDIKGTGCVGGILGYIGGDATFDNCYNEANITGGYYTGGIIGNIEGTITITNCYNERKIIDDAETSAHVWDTLYVNGKSYTGGIIGYAKSTTTISNCYNIEDITSYGDYSGGIIGYGAGKVTLSDCYNGGFLEGEVNKAAGGIIGAIVVDIYNYTSNDKLIYRISITKYILAHK